MHDDESIENIFLRVGKIVNTMRGLGENIEDYVVIEKNLRSISPNFDAKIFTIEEIQDLKSLTLEQLHGILISYEMRKGDTSGVKAAL